MKKITEHLSILNIKTTEKGISGFYKPIGGFFLVERGTKIPEGEYVEIEIVKKIIDKRGKEVPIVRLLPHYHKFESADDEYHECECGFAEKHKFVFLKEEETEDGLLKQIYKCNICGYLDEIYTCKCEKLKFPYESYFLPNKKDIIRYYLCTNCWDNLKKKTTSCVICGKPISIIGWGLGKVCSECRKGIEAHCVWLFPKSQVWDDTCPRCRGTFKCYGCGRELPVNMIHHIYSWFCKDCIG